MMIGLIAENPVRMPDSWTYPLGMQGLGMRGLAELEALFGMSAADSQIPPIGLCMDSSGNVVDCGSSQSGSGGTSPCDPAMTQKGYSCYVAADGTVSYVPAGGQAPPQGSPSGTQGGSPTATTTGGVPGGTGTGQCLGIFGLTTPGQWICQHKTALLIAGVIALTLVVREKV